MRKQLLMCLSIPYLEKELLLWWFVWGGDGAKDGVF